MGVTMPIKQSVGLSLFLGLLLSTLQVADAAKRDEGAENRIAAKLQAMVREVSAERDKLKTENANLAAENQKLNQQLSAETQLAQTAVSAKERLSAELSSANNSHERLQGQIDNTRSKLQDIVEKHKKLNQEKSSLNNQLLVLQQAQTYTESELEICANKNLELLKITRNMTENFNKHGVFDALLSKEPVLGFNDVEIETLIQEYQDKLLAQQYRKNAQIAVTQPVVEQRNLEPEAAKDAENSDDMDSSIQQ